MERHFRLDEYFGEESRVVSSYRENSRISGRRAVYFAEMFPLDRRIRTVAEALTKSGAG